MHDSKARFYSSCPAWNLFELCCTAAVSLDLALLAAVLPTGQHVGAVALAPQKAERLKQSLHFIGMAPQNKHTVFVDDAKEAAKFKPSKYFDTPAELVGRAYNRPRNAQLQQQPAIDPAVAAKAEK